MAARLGYDVRIVTATDESYVFPPWTDDEQVHVRGVPSRETTTFGYHWEGTRRVQRLLSTASIIKPSGIPPTWRASDIWHLAPVANEIDQDVVNDIPDSAFLGLTPQGWLRHIGRDLVVHAAEWQPSQVLLSRAQAIVLSREDTPNAHTLAEKWAKSNTVVAVTEAAEGATIFTESGNAKVAALEVNLVDELGAGDVFGVVFFDRLAHRWDPIDAGVYAVVAGGLSVEASGTGSPPWPEEIERALATRWQRRG